MSIQASPRAARRDFSSSQLKLIRRSIARACTDAEFDEFIAVASQAELDPLRRQISPLVLNPNDGDRRRMIAWATIDGLRVIAARCGDYRPMETAPFIETSDARIDPQLNPLGVVRAEVRAWKLSEGVWHPVAGEAWWDEYAALREERVDPGVGDTSGSAGLTLHESWRRRGRVMIAKCAEAQALRRGWPDVLSGLYGEEELHALRIAEQTATERLMQKTQAADQLRTAHANSLWFVFNANEPMESVPRGEVKQRVGAYYERAAASDIQAFIERNKLSLDLFWDAEPMSAFALKQAAEAKLVAARAPKHPAKSPRRRHRAPKPIGPGRRQ